MKRVFRRYHKNSIMVQVVMLLILTLAIYFGAYYQGG